MGAEFWLNILKGAYSNIASGSYSGNTITVNLSDTNTAAIPNMIMDYNVIVIPA